jgi:hypothetical protein
VYARSIESREYWAGKGLRLGQDWRVARSGNSITLP